jgi:hypothetical protein
VEVLHAWRQFDLDSPDFDRPLGQPNKPAGGKCEGQEWIDNVDLRPAYVLRDIGQCKLPNLSWVIPARTRIMAA